MSQPYNKLKALLKELFQLDQPDLDFGFYRIMHAKAQEISTFLDKDLLPQIQAAFDEYADMDKAKLQRELDGKIQQLKRLDEEPEQNTQVLKLREQLQQATDVRQLEAETYDHLYSFFRRYYSEGDYLSKRVYKQGVYAIPYEGEEVKLHWANSDQYYIKTSEYLRDYAFRLRPDDSQKPMRVHFRLVDAAEGEHGNVKAIEGKERVFILAAGQFIHEEQGELIISFAYRSATLQDKTDSVLKTESVSGQTKPPTQKELIALAVEKILSVNEAGLSPWINELAQAHCKVDGEQADYTRLEAHLRRYTARNTFDYFIHKDLGGFLRRELDFYIKNEIMHLDDVENESFERVKQYLSKIKILRRIAGKIISFLAQLEDFQKKLWLKKKFVIATEYCITLDRIPEAFYPEIAANDAQREEWVKLFAIDEIKGDLLSPNYTVPLTVEFLQANNKLLVDTGLFNEDFKTKLISNIQNFDEQCSGLLIHSENFQALNLLQERYHEKIKCIYIDPPYNTGNDGFPYKDSYQHSSWFSFIESRIIKGISLLNNEGVNLISIDDWEASNLKTLLHEIFCEDNFIEQIIWKKRSTPPNDKTIGAQHEYIIVFAKNKLTVSLNLRKRDAEQIARYKNPDNHLKGPWTSGDLMANVKGGRFVSSLHFPIKNPTTGQEHYPSSNGNWRFNKDKIENLIERREIWFGEDGKGRPKLKRFLCDVKEGISYTTLWDFVPLNTQGSQEMSDILGFMTAFESPKPTGLIEEVYKLGANNDSIILDYFAGSGTSAHAVINLNREDCGKRKYILVEIGDYFDTVLKTRIAKIVYSGRWKDGKPVLTKNTKINESDKHQENHKGIDKYNSLSQCFKYIRLESYEDTLNNLELHRSEPQQSLFDLPEAQCADGFKEEYLLRYMLDVETQGSQSLLNIQAFADPTAYQLKVKRPGSDESRLTTVDLLETFNYLIGLTVRHIAAPQTFTAEFVRDGEKRLQVKDSVRWFPNSSLGTPDCQAPACPETESGSFKDRVPKPELGNQQNGPWWFRTVTGSLPDGTDTLIIWRKLTGDVEQDNRVLDAWFVAQGHAEPGRPFGLVYVNGDNTLENLKPEGEVWRVRLIEEDFQRLMFDNEGR